MADHPINERAVAVHPHVLRGHNLVPASGGWRKVATIRAALRLPRPGTPITDETAAERLATDEDP